MRVAISACLCGRKCRYDATDNLNEELLALLVEHTLVPFCPEDHAFGSPRPTMDLIECGDTIRAISNTTGEDLSDPVIAYAEAFFDSNEPFDLYIGKDRSPSCSVKSARLYDTAKRLISSEAAGLMSAEALKRGIRAYDAELFVKI